MVIVKLSCGELMLSGTVVCCWSCRVCRVYRAPVDNSYAGSDAGLRKGLLMRPTYFPPARLM